MIVIIIIIITIILIISISIIIVIILLSLLLLFVIFIIIMTIITIIIIVIIITPSSLSASRMWTSSLRLCCCFWHQKCASVLGFWSWICKIIAFGNYISFVTFCWFYSFLFPMVIFIKTMRSFDSIRISEGINCGALLDCAAYR